jgi:hypothetical protein
MKRVNLLKTVSNTSSSGGASGYSGYSGAGTSGFSGYSGVSGRSGWSGYSGVSGQTPCCNQYVFSFIGDIVIGAAYYTIVGPNHWTLTHVTCDGDLVIDGTDWKLTVVNTDTLESASWTVQLDGNPCPPTSALTWNLTASNFNVFVGSVSNCYTGQSGFSGVSGDSVSGNSGWSGYSGRSGWSGYSGVSGAAGAAGSNGASGFSGYSGVSGWSGYSGVSGAAGAAGATGTSGFSGYSGVSGTSGWSGYSGLSGYSGVSGLRPCCNSYVVTITGSAGSNGTWTLTSSGANTWTGTGPNGTFTLNITSGNWRISGNDSLDNAVAWTASATTNGCPPKTGWTGSTGTIALDSCYDGASGYSGFSGFSGKSGWSGFSGVSGTSGWSGYSGVSGTSGWSGFSGKSGWSGYSGVSGASGAAFSQVFSRITSDQTTTDATTGIDITGASFSVGANETWTFEIYGSHSCDNTGGIQYSFALPTSPTAFKGAVWGANASATSFRNDVLTAAASWTGNYATFNGAVTSGANGLLRVTGIIRNGSNSGTLQLRLRATVGGQTASVYTDTYLIAQKVS